jgi:hypothetical protein
MNKIKTHIEDNLQWVKFNHKDSQKEDFIMD